MISPRGAELRSGGRYLGGRLLGGCVVLVLVSFGLFALTYVAPGGAEQALAGPYATPEQTQQVREVYQLDDPFLTQYVRYAKSLTSLDMGTSFMRREPVATSVGRALDVSVPLMFFSWLIALVVGGTLGVVSALRQGSRFDRGISTLGVVGASTPIFATAMIMTWVLSVKLGWLPTQGAGTGGIDTVRHFVVPVSAMAIILLAAASRITRSSVVDVLDSDHVTFARSRGLGFRKVLVHDVLRNAAVPLATQAGGLLVALFGGLVVVEAIFGLGGTGSLMTEAISARDVPLIQGVALTIAVAIVLINIAVDMLVLALDPRVRKGVLARG